MQIQKSFEHEESILYIVSTPIGNLQDFTFRAIEVLKSVDRILCEDTRVASKLLNHFEIKNKLISYQKFNEQEKLNEIITALKGGSNIALISDAGTPLVNDPGFLLVKEAIKNDINVVSIPGASAILTALTSSGLIPQPFTFIGFIPRKQGEQKSLLRNYVNRMETLVIYESPLRVSKTLSILYEVLGNRQVVLGRELTKKFETFYRGELSLLITEEFDERGEYVILVEGHVEEESKEFNIIDKVNEFISSGLSEKDAIKEVAKLQGVHKSEIYKLYKLN